PCATAGVVQCGDASSAFAHVNEGYDGSSSARCGDGGRRGRSVRPGSPRKWLLLCSGREEAADLGEPRGKGVAEVGNELVGLARKEEPEELSDGEEVQDPHAEAERDHEEDHD